MSKTILAHVDGFTPLIDSVVQDVGIMGAAVFGRMWRYCQMKDGVCRASLITIGKELEIDQTTALRHAHALVEKGYLNDLTPNLHNHAHTYADTGKAGLNISLVAGTAQNSTGTAQNSTSTVNYNTKKEEETKKETIKPSVQKDLTKNISLDWFIQAGVSSEELAELSKRENVEKECARVYEVCMGYNPLPWWTDNKLKPLLKFLLTKTGNEIATFATWARREYSTLTPSKARQYPHLVIECWPQAFTVTPKTKPRAKPVSAES